MNPVQRSLIILAASLALFSLSGCEERDTGGLPPAVVSTDRVVFDDDFAPGLRYDAFENSYYEALDIDDAVFYDGYASLVLNVRGTPLWAGGAFSLPTARDLTGYNALTVWAKASESISFDNLGYGVDVMGTSYNEASRKNIAMDTGWRRIIVPIPNPDRLDIEKGLFFVSDSDATPDSIRVWLDEVQFDSVAGLEVVEAHMADLSVETFIGLPIKTDMYTVFAMGTDTLTVSHGPAYYDFSYSTPGVAGYMDGQLMAVGAGITTITARLATSSSAKADTMDVFGAVTVTVGPSPTAPAPAPALASDDVIPFYCDQYTISETLDIRWNTYWGGTTTEITDLKIAGDNVMVYSELNWVGVEFNNAVVDVSGMTHFHMDIWAPEGTGFKIEVVDFGADGIYSPYIDDSKGVYEIGAESTPAFVTGEWIALDVPLADFTGLTTFEHIGQFVFSSGDAGTVFVDNVYFHK